MTVHVRTCLHPFLSIMHLNPSLLHPDIVSICKTKQKNTEKISNKKTDSKSKNTGWQIHERKE